ncbi:TlyA family RNA methyltransferase [bacterium]|nr:TlyA family RNA methyltransferase [bacterium]
MRLDVYLVEKGFFKSRTKAQTAIVDEAVLVNGKVVTKANFEILDEPTIEIIKESCPYVSRGGVKLEFAIKEFFLDFQDKIILDIGASTGGFTDCALQHGAKEVYAVDVGTNQLDPKLKLDARVISYEQTNILDVPSFPVEFDYIVMDVSFVTIEHILPAIQKFLKEEAIFICLIKPQYEVGKRYLKNGIVKDRSLHIKVLEQVIQALHEYGMGIVKLISSPILGGSGNKEFLACIKKNVETRVNYIEVCK